jgi:putative ABC transport system permease protein
MPFEETLRIAFTALRANKVRAALTMLGIMIGVSAVITLLAIGDGVQRFVADQFIGLGTNLVYVVPQQEEFGPPGSDSLTESSLTMRDAQYLGEPGVLTGASGVAPLVTGSADVQYGRNTIRNRILASTPDYGPMRGYVAERGRFFDSQDYLTRSRVAVIGQDVVTALYPPDVDPVGTAIRIRGFQFQVIGVLEAKGSSGLGGSQDDVIIVPLTTAQERIFNLRSSASGQQLVQVILVQAEDARVVDDLILQISDILRQRHGISFRDEDDFSILTQQDFLSAFGSVTTVLTLFLGSIAAISLLVGGIGIMNIMLVSVTERTREIGLRKAVGAGYRDILIQFLAEALALALLGGVAGIVIGWLGSVAVNLFVPQLTTTVSWGTVLLATGFSALIGIFFGIYPASRAAALHPIEALRFE